MLEFYIQLLLQEQRFLKPTYVEGRGICRRAPHSMNGLTPAVLQHSRHMRTWLDITGQVSPAAKNPSFKVGAYVRVRRPVLGPKGTPFSNCY